MHEFILHSSLDVVEHAQWQTNQMYLKTVDRYNELQVTCLVTPSSKYSFTSPAIDARFLLLHDGRNEDSIKSFFNEVYELFVKVVMNPFYEANHKISLGSFDERVKSAARKHL